MVRSSSFVGPTCNVALFWSLLLPSFVFPVVKAQSTGSGDCSDVHMFLARGDQEPYPGRMGVISNAICAAFEIGATCDYEDIVFESTASTTYCDSCFNGANAGIGQVQAYNKRCPKAAMVLVGYSLGAQSVGDMLGGGGGAFYTCQEGTVTSPFSPTTAPGNMIAAALLFGDTRHDASQTYNIGTGSGLAGQYPRSAAELASLNRFSAILQNYCLITDPLCANGQDGISHTTYQDLFAVQAANLTVGMVLKVNPSLVPQPVVTTSSSSTTPTATSSQTSSATATSSTTATSKISSTPVSSPSASSSGSAGSNGGLSGGAKAGIAVGVIVLLALLGLGAFFIWRKKRQQKLKEQDEKSKADIEVK